MYRTICDTFSWLNQLFTRCLNILSSVTELFHLYLLETDAVSIKSAFSYTAVTLCLVRTTYTSCYSYGSQSLSVFLQWTPRSLCALLNKPDTLNNSSDFWLNGLLSDYRVTDFRTIELTTNEVRLGTWG